MSEMVDQTACACIGPQPGEPFCPCAMALLTSGSMSREEVSDRINALVARERRDVIEGVREAMQHADILELKAANPGSPIRDLYIAVVNGALKEPT